MEELGIGLSIILAQSILETGYNTKIKATHYLGIKSHSRANGQILPTKEEVDGSMANHA